MLKREVVKDQRRRMNSKNLIQGVQRKGKETVQTKAIKDCNSSMKTKTLSSRRTLEILEANW